MSLDTEAIRKKLNATMGAKLEYLEALAMCDEIDQLQDAVKALKQQLRLTVAQRNSAEDELRASKSQGAV